MTTLNTFLISVVGSLMLAGCGGGSGDSEASPPASPPLINDPTDELVDDPKTIEEPVGLPTDAQARYRVTIENFWGVENFPQGFPEDAHLSLIGGATHNAAVSFWEEGVVASRGIEDMAEAGLIDKLLFDEVVPAITNGTANSMIEIREYTSPSIDGEAGVLGFDIDVNREWPLVSMVTMLGPSPDWFVGVSGQSLLDDDSGWELKLSVDLPLYDAGTKSDITPVMGGPDIIPPDPVGLVAYDAAAGVYLPSREPQNVARLTFERISL